MTSFIATPQKWQQAWDENWQQKELKRVQVAVAYCTLNGAQEICRMWGRRKPQLELLVGLNDGVTDVDAQRFLFEWAQSENQIEIRSELQESGRFHPKIYAFTFSDEVRVLVGSVNLTRGAFERNTEATFHLTPSHFEQHEIFSALQGWWQHAKTLLHPDDFQTQSIRIGVRKTLLELMRRGAFVKIEALLESSRTQFGRDIFDLGQLRSFKSESIKLETSRHQTISLLSPAIYRELEAQKKKAHENCAYFSVRYGGNQFVPAMVFKEWKAQHEIIKAQFESALKPFLTVEGRKVEKAELEGRLRKELDELAAKVRKEGSAQHPKEEDLQKLIKNASAVFDLRAPHFSRTVKLDLQISPQPLPSLLGSQGRDSLESGLLTQKYTEKDAITLMDSGFEFELKRYAEANEEQILRQWMQTLVCSPRQVVFEGFDASNQFKAHDKQTGERKKAAKQLRPLNFLGDQFIQNATRAFLDPHYSLAALRHIRNQAHDEWSRALKWYDEEIPFEAVLEQFALMVGWK